MLGLGLGGRCRRRRPRTARRHRPRTRSRIHRGAGASPSGRLPSPPRACCRWRAPGLDPRRRPRPGSVRPLLGARDQLRLELHEPVDDAARDDDVDLVEAQLDPRVAVADDALAAQLADGHELDERRVAGLLEDERAGVRRGPVERAGASGRPDLRAPRAGPTPPGPSVRAERLDRHDRALARLPEPDGEPGPGHRPVGGVDVAVLELRRPRRGGPAERADLRRPRGSARRRRGRRPGT